AAGRVHALAGLRRGRYRAAGAGAADAGAGRMDAVRGPVAGVGRPRLVPAPAAPAACLRPAAAQPAWRAAGRPGVRAGDRDRRRPRAPADRRCLLARAGPRSTRRCPGPGAGGRRRRAAGRKRLLSPAPYNDRLPPKEPVMTRKTPLNDAHRALGAKMVDFGGWDMPLHYGSQVDEHHQVRRDAGMFDVSHMTVVDLHGDDVRGFLRGLVANSVDKLKVKGKALYTCMLDERGGVIDDLIVYYMDDTHYRLVVNAATREKDLAWIRKQAPTGVDVREREDLAIVAVQGPTARERVASLLDGDAATRAGKLGRFSAIQVEARDGTPLFLARTGYTGEDGFEVVVPADRVAALWQSLLDAGV